MKRALAVAGLALSVWIGWDLLHSEAALMSDFSPNEVARLETAMWRSYYERRPVALYGQLVETLRGQYHLSFWSSGVAAYHAAKAAVVFQRGKDRAGHEEALPDLVAYYGAIRRFSREPFSVERVARLELEWWIVHRQRAGHAPGDLERALAELQAEMYGRPVEAFRVYAAARARAMELRDGSAAAGGTQEGDWRQIERDLTESWVALSRVVRSGVAI
jgi:hypothetical protein